MAKYLEAPTKPQVVHAVQYTGVENQVPTFDEPVPGWLAGAMLRGRLSIGSGTLTFDGTDVPVGAFFMVDEGDEVGETLRCVAALVFMQRFRPSRKKPVRKSKAALSVAAE